LQSSSPPLRGSSRASFLIGAGIFLSRVLGLVRERVIAMFFGTGLHADVFAAALRLPNVLQNLLGEGTLSASFIPVYSELLGQGRNAEAGRVAGAVFALLLAIVGVLTLIGVTLAPLLVSVLTPGFEGQRRELMIDVLRLFVPMTAMLVLSAWALGILNSHRRFFVPYFAPVLWNAAIIGALLAFGGRVALDDLLIAGAWGALAGGALQFAVQLPFVLRLDREIRLNSGRSEPGFRETVRNAGPAILGRGVVQLSSYIDLVLVTLLAIGAAARLRYAQTLYVLPVSLFAMSVAAAELPELARERMGAIAGLAERIADAARRVAFFVVPSVVGYLVLGETFVTGLYLTGEFTATDASVVYLILAAYSLGMLASTTTRVYQSAFFALRDTRTPARIAALRVLVSAMAGAYLMLQFEPVTVFGIAVPAGAFADVTVSGVALGPVGLGLGASLGAWLEWFLLRRRLRGAVGDIGTGFAPISRMIAGSGFAAAAGFAAGLVVSDLQPLLSAFVVAAVFGAVYVGAGIAFGLPQARAFAEAGLRLIRLNRRL
jgi:putative peptidoglycan lipid II flippase